MTITPATERVAFQPNSPLAKKLVKLCGDFLAWVEETRKARIVDGKLPPATQGRIVEARTYAEKTFAPALVKLFEQQLNLKVKISVLTSATYANGVMAPIFMDIIRTKNYALVEQGYDLFSGLSSKVPQGFHPEVFTALSDTLDLETSKLLAKLKDYFIYVGIYSSSYLGRELFGDMPELTAEEEAAVLLHEIGHGMTILEHMGELYHRADVAANSVKYLNESADAKTTSTALTTIDAVVKTLPPEQQPELVNTLARLQDTAAPVQAFQPLVACISLLCFVISVPFITLIRFFVAGQYGAINAGDTKTSDTVVTAANKSYVERIADEFVARHGLGAALAAGELKYDIARKAGYVRTELADAIRGFAVARAMVLSFGIVERFFGMFAHYDDGTYDPRWLRLEHILRNNLVIFKDDSLSDELRVHFVNETKKLLETIATYQNMKSVQIHQFFWGTVMRILSRSSIVDGIRTANLSNDYDKLQLMTNGLVKNKLLYHAARLKNL